MSLPLIIGHRGASAVAPENTLAAFKQAVRDKADGIEFDVRLSHDGVPVVVHDRDLRRTGLQNAKVSDLSSNELSKINVGKWFNLRYPSRRRDEYERETIPTLEDVFRLFNKTDHTLYVEMKADKRDARTLEEEVVRLIRVHNLVTNVVLESFALDSIAEAKRLAPEIKTAALFERKLSSPAPSARALIEAAVLCGANEISLHHTLVGKRSVARAHERNLDVAIWTVDAPSWIKRADALGIRALITNAPALMRKTLNDFRAT